MESQGEIWEVFIQTKPGLAHKHVGNIRAYDQNMAIEKARDVYTRRNEGTSIWVAKTNNIISSNPNDSEMLFDPANDKIYRQATFYNLPKEAKNI